MSFEIKPARRQGIVPLIFIWGGTGGGKSFTALTLARGMAGPKGRIVCADTENGRALLCAPKGAEILPGDVEFNHIDFQPPFTPERYAEVLEKMEQNADVGVIDSASHLWAGPDGVLEMHEAILDKMVGDDYAKREAANWRAWKEPKARLEVFKQRLLRHKIPLIVCFRGEEKSQLVKDDKGRNQVVTSKTTLPIFDKKLIFEGLISFELFQENGKGGLMRLPYPHAKVSHWSLEAILPKPEKERLTQAHGAAIAAWCANSGATASVPSVTPPVPDEVKALKAQLWNLLKPVRGTAKDWKAAQEWMESKTIITVDEFVSAMDAARLRQVIAEVEFYQSEKPKEEQAP